MWAGTRSTYRNAVNSLLGVATKKTLPRLRAKPPWFRRRMWTHRRAPHDLPSAVACVATGLIIVAVAVLPLAGLSSALSSCSTAGTPSCAANTVLALTSTPTNNSLYTAGVQNNVFYTNGLDCTWRVTVPAPLRLVVWFTHLDLENSTACQFDALSIFDGGSAPTAYAVQSASNPLVAFLCGNHGQRLPDPYVLGQAALVHLTTDSAGVASGFLLNYASFTPATCAASTVVTDSSVFGVFAAPSVAMPMQFVPAYSKGVACSWTVTVSAPGTLDRYVAWSAFRHPRLRVGVLLQPALRPCTSPLTVTR